jgi:hypothetical protein
MGRLLVLAAIALAPSTLFVACGGSSSESPWPVEPDSPVLGPAGEDGKPSSSHVISDAGTDSATSIEP